MKNYVQEAVNEAISKNGVFFAFSKKQLDEKTVKGIEYVNMGNGSFCPKLNVKNYINEMHNAAIKGALKEIEESGEAAIIEYEYFNHECQITSDLSDMKDALNIYKEAAPDKFTEAKIKSVAAACFQKAIDEDWF